MPTQIEQAFLALLRFELTQKAVPSEILNDITAETLPEIYALAQRHDMAHLVTGALEKTGRLGTDAVSEQFKKIRYAAVFRYEQIRYELDAICAALSEAKIRHIPLKGAVIRAWYDEPWMRTSCDIDILVRPDDLQAASAVFTDALGYRGGSEGTHDVSFFSPGGLHVELHHSTVEEGRAVRASDVLATVWDTVTDSEEYTCRMSDAMFYFYHIAHMAKHIEIGGCGVRAFMDLWILNHRAPADAEGRARLLQQGGLLRFADVASQLAERWFSEGEADDTALLLEVFILYGGVYGNVETNTAVEEQHGGKWRWRMALVFPRFYWLKYQYPILKRHAWLYPFCLLHRLGRKTIGKDRKRAAAKLKQVMSVDDSKREAAAALLKGLELSDN